MATTYDSVTIAEYMLSLSLEKRIVLNVTKVQKLLYMAYGTFLAKKTRTISSEPPKAWPFGPVFPRTRNKVDFGSIRPLDWSGFEEIKKDEELTESLNLIIEKYSKFSASKLSDWSHREGGPWDKATKMNGFKWGDVIPDEFIVEYFSNLNI
jgi:uncharacterized phage-associated protein